MKKTIYTTERTGKTWKGLQAVGCLGLSTGVILVYLGTWVSRQEAGEPVTQIVLSNLAIVGILIFLSGFGLHAFGRLAGWWFHG